MCGGARRSSGVDVHRIPVLLAAIWQLHHRCHTPLRRWLSHNRNGTLVQGLRGPRRRGSFHRRCLLRRTLLRDAPALGPRGLEDEGLLHTVGRALLRAPTGLSFSIRSGGAGRVALTGLNVDGHLGSTTDTTLAGLLGVGRLSSRLGATLAGVALTAVTLPLPGSLRCLGPSGHGLP